MFKVNAYTKKGTQFRFRIQSDNIHNLRATLKAIFEGQEMRLVLVVPV